METKLRIEKSFHRFVTATDAGGNPLMITIPQRVRDENGGSVWKDVEHPAPERKESFAAGQTVTVPETDAADWLAKGLAVELDGSQPASERTPA